MDPGPDVQNLPELTQMEEMLISSVHALTQLWQVNSGQYKYTGHVCNFPRKTAIFHKKVPLLPEKCKIIIMQHRGMSEAEANTMIFEDFQVRRETIQQWLEYLTVNHSTFYNHQVEIDHDCLSQLSEDRNVHGCIHTIQREEMSLRPEGSSEQQDGTEGENIIGFMFSAGFTSNLNMGQTELELLETTAQHSACSVLTMPLKVWKCL